MLVIFQVDCPLITERTQRATFTSTVSPSAAVSVFNCKFVFVSQHACHISTLRVTEIQRERNARGLLVFLNCMLWRTAWPMWLAPSAEGRRRSDGRAGREVNPPHNCKEGGFDITPCFRSSRLVRDLRPNEQTKGTSTQRGLLLCAHAQLLPSVGRSSGPAQPTPMTHSRDASAHRLSASASAAFRASSAFFLAASEQPR